METSFLSRLAEKTITKEQLYREVESNWSLLPKLIDGVSSTKASIRYGCGKVLMDLSQKYPDRLYPFMEIFVQLLDGKHRILVWNASIILANLSAVDSENLLDAHLNRYLRLLNDPYLVTVANAIKGSVKIAIAKPQLKAKIIKKLLGVENISLTPHLTEECKRVLIEQTIESFEKLFDLLDAEEQKAVVDFAKCYVESPRKSLSAEACRLIRKNEISE